MQEVKLRKQNKVVMVFWKDFIVFRQQKQLFLEFMAQAEPNPFCTV